MCDHTVILILIDSKMETKSNKTPKVDSGTTSKTNPKSETKSVKKSNKKKKKKKKKQSKKENSILSKVAAEEKAFLDRRLKIAEDASALEAELETLIDENDRLDRDGREGLVEKLREEVASSNTTSQASNIRQESDEEINSTSGAPADPNRNDT